MSREENTLHHIERDMIYCNLGYILLAGDLNATTNTELDFIKNDANKKLPINVLYIRQGDGYKR